MINVNIWVKMFQNGKGNICYEETFQALVRGTKQCMRIPDMLQFNSPPQQSLKSGQQSPTSRHPWSQQQGSSLGSSMMALIGVFWTTQSASLPSQHFRDSLHDPLADMTVSRHTRVVSNDNFANANRFIFSLKSVFRSFQFSPNDFPQISSLR